MTIKNAKQSGNMVAISYDYATRSVQGELIGFTQNAVFVKHGNNLHVYRHQNGSFSACGYNITVTPSDEVKMYGNCAGIKRKGSTTVRLYDENGKPAGSRNV